MNISLEIIAVALGFIIRLGVPIALTLLLALFLKWLDKRWQAQAQSDAAESALRMELPMAERPHCWEIHNCPASLRDKCPAFAHPDTPCWELSRSNGHLKPACRSCKVPPPEIADNLVLV